MNIGIITEANASFYSKSYPALREEQPYYRALVNEGHNLIMLCPLPSDSVRKKHLVQKDPWKTQEWFSDRVGVKFRDEDISTEPKIDVLLITNFPWLNSFNYGTIDAIKYWSNKVDTIIWRVVDYEMYAKQKSVLYDIIAKDNPQVFKKIKCVITTDPTLKSKIDKPHYYLPHLYDSFYEIPATLKSERKLLSKFVGPIGFRKGIADFLPDLNEVCARVGKGCEFYGEDFGAKYRDSQFTFENSQFSSLDVYGKRVFLPYPDYIKFISNSITTFHDSYPPGWLTGKSDVALWYSGKINDALYAGVVPLTTEFINRHQVSLLSLNKPNLEFILQTSDEAYRAILKLQRHEMKQVFGIETWMPKIKEWFGI